MPPGDVNDIDIRALEREAAADESSSPSLQTSSGTGYLYADTSK